MSNTFQNSGSSGKQGVIRRFARVWVGLAMVVAGVVSFAAFPIGDMHRQAAGAIPIIDAGNYVGTEHGEALFEGGGLDISWPRPEGFEGIWFEKKPFGRRENVVWESQRFVGKPVDIPKLKPGQADEKFVGLPDVCSSVVQERMEELGYFADDDLSANYNFIYSCNFANLEVEDLFKMDVIDVSLREDEGKPTEPAVIDDYMKELTVDFISFNDAQPLVSCIPRGEMLENEKRLFIETGSRDSESRIAVCRRNGLFWQVISNIMGEY